MGGQALASRGARRYLKRDYFDLAENKVLPTLRKLGISTILIPSYLEKESFGDMDVLLESETLPMNWSEVILKEFGVAKEDSVKNGDCLSILVDSLQVDLIKTPKSEMISSKNYFEYNDLGNLISRQSKAMGIKFSHYGLSLIVRCPDKSDQILGEILLETDSGKDVLFDILGIKNRPIKNPNDLFEFVASSKFFMKSLYYLENRNSDSRRRDKLRKNYHDFLLWIDQTNPPDNYSFDFGHERNIFYSVREPFYSDLILPRYPWVAEKISEMIEAYQVESKFKEIYNGEFVSSRTGFVGKELGAFMKEMKARYGFDLEMKRKWIETKETTPYVAIAQLEMEWKSKN